MATVSAGSRVPLKDGFAEQPVLRVPLELWNKLMSYVLVCPTEVNGFGLITRIGPSLFVLDDVFITEQVAGPASVDVMAQTIAATMTKLATDGVDTGRLRFQWHSHVDFGAYFSPTDLGNIETYSGWMLSLVVNKRSEWEARLDVFQPFRVSSPLKVEIDGAPTRAQLEAAMAEIRQFVRQSGRVGTRTVQPQQPVGGQWPSIPPQHVSTVPAKPAGGVQ